MRRFLVSAAMILLFGGCATAPKTSYVMTDPGPRTVSNETHIDRPFGQVWDGLVAKLSESFFVINNIEKESRLINLSFSTTSPEKYIDCGKMKRTYKRGKTEQVFEYDIAAATRFKYAEQAGNNQYVDYDVVKRTSLEGRINVYVAPDGDGTRVSVNVRYVFASEMTGSYEVIAGALKMTQSVGTMPPNSSSLSFSTKEVGKEDWGTATRPEYVTCCSTGMLEKTILDMAVSE